MWLWPNVNEHFNYEEGDSIIVEAYSNCENVELFLGDVSLGKKYLFDFEDHIYRWALSYKKESLRAVGKIANGEHIECCLIPTSKPNHLKITIPRIGDNIFLKKKYLGSSHNEDFCIKIKL